MNQGAVVVMLLTFFAVVMVLVAEGVRGQRDNESLVGEIDRLNAENSYLKAALARSHFVGDAA